MDGSHELVRTFHSTCTVTDYDRTVAALARLVGMRVLEYSEAEHIGRRGGMTWLGDNSIEVSQPIVAGHAAERFLRKFGPGMHSYAFQVTDLDATIDHLSHSGVGLGARPDTGFCFTDPRTTGGLLFEWSDFTVGEDPRLGAPVPEYAVDPILDVRTHAFVGAVVFDPIEWAESFGEPFGLTEAFRNPDAPLQDPVIGLAAPDCVIALYRLPGTRSRELWGTEHHRPRFHVLGLGVSDLGEAEQVLRRTGDYVLRQGDGSIALNPYETGEVPLLLVEGLFPGDPRL